MDPATTETTKAILDGLTALFSTSRRWLLFFGSGTSCALDPRLGMSALTEHLKKAVGDAADWHKVQSRLEAGQSLEQALTDVGLSAVTKDRIRKVAGDYIAAIDGEWRDAILLGKRRWIGEALIHTLVRRVPPMNPRLAVFTTNYDMLIEYACTVHGIPYTTGFSGQMVRRYNWQQAMGSFSHCMRQDRKSILVPTPRVELFKLHGSINLFSRKEDGGLIECDLWCGNPPDSLDRAIAPPGGQKFEHYARLAKETVSPAGRAENEAMAFAVIGYGFNDPHLHGDILRRVKSQDCPLLVLTRDISDSNIEKMRRLGNRVWILLAGPSTAGGRDDANTAVYSPVSDDPVILDNNPLWCADHFAETILGG